MSNFDYRKLNGAQFFVLREAILDSFSKKEIDEVLKRIDKRPLTTLVAEDALQYMVNDLISLMLRRGWLNTLVSAMKQASQSQPIQDIDATLRLMDVEGHPKLVESLERTVKVLSGFDDFPQWVKNLSMLQRRVCRIEYPVKEGTAYGTGFLVGPDRVLTNYHVVRPPNAPQPDASSVVVRFDYAVEDGVASLGREIKLANPGGELKLSPYSKFDPGDVGGTPAADELDFALLRLAEQIGNEEVNGQPRGWIDLNNPAAAPQAGDVLFIVQHPEGKPLKLAIGATTGVNANGTRVRYDANTEGGSSGSPCFNAKLQAVALHHGTDPEYWRPAQFNQGVPIALISPQLPA